MNSTPRWFEIARTLTIVAVVLLAVAFVVSMVAIYFGGWWAFGAFVLIVVAGIAAVVRFLSNGQNYR